MLSLTKKQTEVLKIIEKQEHIFITGGAGVGKSFLIKHFINNLPNGSYSVVAPTGVAAIAIGGTTIHRFFGLSIAPAINQNDGHRDKIVELLKGGLNTIIIDEIGMVRSDTFQLIMLILAKSVSRANEDEDIKIKMPKIILVGDPFQLPPVARDNDIEHIEMFINTRSPWFFDAPEYSNLNFKMLELTEIVRQKEDKKFAEILNRIRLGSHTQSDIKIMNKCVSNNKKDDDGMVLAAINSDVNRINNNKLKLGKKGTKVKVYKAIVIDIDGKVNIKNFPIEEKLRLKKGARVIVTSNKNDNEGNLIYTNGDMGTVTQLEDDIIFVSLDKGFMVEIERNEFEDIDYKAVTNKKGKKEVIAFARGKVRQFPLKLGWAISIHKSQGATYDNAILDLSNVFAEGQAYVALSRLSSLGGLKLKTSITMNTISTNQRVLEFFTKEKDKPKSPNPKNTKTKTKKIPTTSAERQRKFVEKQKQLGRNKIPLFMTREEEKIIKNTLKTLRQNSE